MPYPADERQTPARSSNTLGVNGELIVVDDVAHAFVEILANAWSTRVRDSFSLALSGGDTARRCYERLAASPACVDWSTVDIYWGDERCVAPDDPDSNERLAHEALLDRISPRSINPMRCADGPTAYAAAIHTAGAIDVVHLGLGPDGHTASLFSDSPALFVKDSDLVALNHDPSGQNPHRRMTLTLAGIASARLALFTVAGTEKRRAMQRVLDGEDVPAGRVAAGRVVWLVDREAAPGGV